MSASRTIIEEADRLDNVHPGDILREDFLIGSEIPIEEIVLNAGVQRERLEAVLAAKAPVDAKTDLRLARYFGISEGYLLGLQNDYDLEEVWRVKGPQFERIARRAA